MGDEIETPISPLTEDKRPVLFSSNLLKADDSPHITTS
jgi:hypothetical protein